MTDITELKIEDEAQLIELLSENVVAPYMLPTETCKGFMEMEIGYCNVRPVKIDEENQAYVTGKSTIPIRKRIISILNDDYQRPIIRPTNVNIDVTCDGYIRFFSMNPERKLMWYEPLQPDIPATLIEIPKQKRVQESPGDVIVVQTNETPLGDSAKVFEVKD